MRAPKHQKGAILRAFIETMPAKKSITFVSPFAYSLLSDDAGCGSGGAERQFFLFGRSLTKIGWEVAFITDKANGIINREPRIFNVYYANFSYLGGSNLRIPLDWLSILRAMKSANSRYYVIKVPGHLLAPMSLFCKTHRRQLVFWTQMGFDADPNERSGLHPVANILQDWGLKRTHYVIAQTGDQKKAFKDNFGISAQVVPSICDTLIKNSSTATPSCHKEKQVDVLWVGNSLPKKRQEVFFELAKLLPERGLAIAINDGNLLRFMKAKEDAKRLRNVIFLGTIPPIEMESWFQRTRLFLNTSIQEGFPNTFLQAWMNGVPVISLNIDPDRIISRYMLGTVATTRLEIEGLREKFRSMAELLVPPIELLLNNVEIIEKIARRAQHYVTENHSPSVVVPKLCRVLQRE